MLIVKMSINILIALSLSRCSISDDTRMDLEYILDEYHRKIVLHTFATYVNHSTKEVWMSYAPT